MRKSYVCRLLAVGIACAALFLAGCSLFDREDQNPGSSQLQQNKTDDLAVKVNGVEIKANVIERHVDGFFSSKGLTEEEEIENWLDLNKTSIDEVRKAAIDFFVDCELMNQAARDNGVDITDEEVNAYISEMRSLYSTEEEWKESLAILGMNEESYRIWVKSDLCQNKLIEVLDLKSEDLSDAEERDYASAYASALNGAKKSTVLAFSSNNENEAIEASSKINQGRLSADQALTKYASILISAESGDQGWDYLNSSLREEHRAALQSLERGGASEPLHTGDNLYVVVCTDQFVDPGNVESFDQLPAEFESYALESIGAVSSDTAFSDWFDEYRSQADIEIIK